MLLKFIVSIIPKRVVPSFHLQSFADNIFKENFSVLVCSFISVLVQWRLYKDEGHWRLSESSVSNVYLRTKDS